MAETGKPSSQCIEGSCLKGQTPERCAASCRFCPNWWIRSFPWDYGKEVHPQITALLIQWHEIQNTAGNLDHNANAGRAIATTEAGEARYKCVFPKLQKQWVAKPIFENKSYQFVEDLMNDTILHKNGELNAPPLERPVLPQNIAATPRGNKEDIIAKHVSRFV